MQKPSNMTKITESVSGKARATTQPPDSEVQIPHQMVASNPLWEPWLQDWEEHREGGLWGRLFYLQPTFHQSFYLPFPWKMCVLPAEHGPWFFCFLFLVILNFVLIIDSQKLQT